MNTLIENSWIQIIQKHRFLIAHLRKPHRVLSTCSVNGGIRTDLTHLINQQSTEGSSLHERAALLHQMNHNELHHECCRLCQVPEASTATMGTAANMDYAAIRQERYQDTEITALATAGVEGNAGRAGDPASFHEGEDGYEAVHKQPGTINIMLFCNQSLSLGALTRASVTLTEAKTAALLQLGIPSRYSAELATGTGTDQFIIAAPLTPQDRYHWTGNHSKLGELIGCAVRDAVLESLRWQNGLEFSRTRTMTQALGRFGLGKERFLAMMQQIAEPDQQVFFPDAWTMIDHDPKVAAVAWTIAALLDKKQYGILPEAPLTEAITRQCALLVASLAHHLNAIAQWEAQLAGYPWEEQWVRAIYLGWIEKWKT